MWINKIFKLFQSKKYIIFVHISGGLGNQLFQISNVLQYVSVLKKQSYYLIFLYTGNPLVKKSHEYPRLKDLGLKSVCFDSKASKWIIRLLKLFGWGKLVNLNIEGKNAESQPCLGLNFIEGLNQRMPNTTIVRFLNKKLKFSQPSQKYSVLHIRLGDYLTEESQGNVGVVSDSFYILSMQALQKFGYPIWVVSDGKELQINQILGRCSIPYKINKPGRDLDDLEFIANAEVVAICNSTFSLWACYLQQKQQVFYPQKWFPARLNGETENPRVDKKWSAINSGATN